MVKRCTDSLSETVSKIRDKMVGSAPRHFDETEIRGIKNSGGFLDWYVPERMAISLVGDVSFGWSEAIGKLKFRHGIRRKNIFPLVSVLLSCKKLPEVEQTVPKDGTSLYYYFVVE